MLLFPYLKENRWQMVGKMVFIMVKKKISAVLTGGKKAETFQRK